MGNKSKHSGKLQTSDRLQKLHRALLEHQPCTTMELIKLTESANISADIWDLRDNGVNVKCTYRGLTPKTHRKVSQFHIEED